MTVTPGVSGFPLKVLINGIEFFEFNQFTVNRDINSFVDSFNITVFNPAASHSTKIPVGGYIEMEADGVPFFRGIIEKKEVTFPQVGSTMMLSGREELVYMSETEVDPSLGEFKNITDNEIIKTIINDGQSIPWTLQLGQAKKIEQFTVPSGGMTKGKAIEDVVKFNDFVMIKKGTTLYKLPVPRSPNTTIAERFRVTEANGNFFFLNSRIMNVVLSEDITRSRSQITGYTYTKGKKKLETKVDRFNKDLTDGTYAHRLRNKTIQLGISLNRRNFLAAPGKQAVDIGVMLTRAMFDNDLQASVKFQSFGLSPLELLDTVDVEIEIEGISQYMYVAGLEYHLDQENHLYTNITLCPFPKAIT